MTENEFLYSIFFSSIVEYNFTISHKENSTAHVMDVEVVWMLPVYTRFLIVTKKTHQLTKHDSGNNVMFKVRNSATLH